MGVEGAERAASPAGCEAFAADGGRRVPRTEGFPVVRDSSTAALKSGPPAGVAGSGFPRPAESLPGRAAEPAGLA